MPSCAFWMPAGNCCHYGVIKPHGSWRLDKHVLWVRTGFISDFLKPGPLWAALQWLISPSQWQDVGRALWQDLRAQPEFYTVALLVRSSDIPLPVQG